jgi:hypothetical protein
MFELIVDSGEVKIVRENRYKLVGSADISVQDLLTYSTLSKPHV